MSILETTDIFFSAYLRENYKLLDAIKTNGHKVLFKFEVKEDHVQVKMGYSASLHYKIKLEIDNYI